ncbi:DDE-type integrase/transposase/recombinase [Alkaliphilus serpentinus]|uniref:DDE-type integrase/transposase/recombinase n=1 Tax=Alkaliphilus serpentinus TaxID=1482731 RepID=A0A833M959_9FIRM|nr:DDE-type integrase/transposase/recombinase [Alkaliphilus serpentinus]KAB3527094.1 DDE-type integrase/transposase/recombinase [Alkaliphilus serpentinus]
MNSIISHLLLIIQYQNQHIRWLVFFISKYVPLAQWAFDDVHSPKYQRFKTDILPVIQPFIKQDWQFLLAYYEWKYKKKLKPVNRRNGKSIPEDTSCPLCGATHHYLYDNNGDKGQYQCKVCGKTFITGEFVTKKLKLKCPYCSHSLSPIKSRKFFTIHKCVNKKCSYYLHNLKNVDKGIIEKGQKYKHKLHYIYREFNVDFFNMDINSLPKNAFSLKFRKNNAHIMSLCLTFHVNLGLSLRKTAQALEDLYGIKVSHTMVANYARTAAVLVKPFVDNYDYSKSNTFVADETYIKVKGIKGYIWFIMDAVSRSIIGYQVSDNRTVGPCILAMRMAFKYVSNISHKFKFIADGYSAYPLAAQQFALRDKNPLHFDITQVIGLSNDDAVSKEFRPYKQMVERLNRTFKVTYRCSCGYDNFDGANYAVSLWVCYYNFLRKHTSKNDKVLNSVDMIENADNMPGKWQILIFLGQQTILELQREKTLIDCS